MGIQTIKAIKKTAIIVMVTIMTATVMTAMAVTVATVGMMATVV